MTLQPGSRLGSYEILSALGAGGMGEVYRARDTKLNRNVAIKVLPDVFANDPERLARFHREAQVLAALNHPNIAHIHGVEDSDRIHALVMELVDGPTLAEWIAQGPIPISDALPIAKQIAEALDAAHDQGIIHRDLKPANVKVREDGTVKVLDFGLARLVAPDASGAGAGTVTQSPTFTTPAATVAGVILGTAAYMSPEQAKGRAADKRSDVWAFGAVLYEMLTGRRPFEGEDLSDTLAAVLKSEPDWNALPPDVPPHIRMLIQRCLTKDRRQRLADMSIALFVMTEVAGLVHAAVATSAPTAPLARPPLWRRLVIPTAAVLVVGAAIGTAVWLVMRPGGDRVTRFALSSTGAAALSVDNQSIDLAITRDGTHIVYKGAEPPARSFSCAHWMNSSRRRSWVWARRVPHSLRPMGNGSASSTRARSPSRSRKWPSPADRPSLSAGSTVQAGASPGVTTTASFSRRPRHQPAFSACRPEEASRRS